MRTTFADLVSGREEGFPYLARAVRDQGPPPFTWKIEWLLDVPVEGEPGVVRRVVWENFAQIVRFAKPAAEQASEAASVSLTDDAEAWDYLLATTEQVLEHGAPAFEWKPMPLGLCGGFRHYLGRDLRDDDLLSLRVVREPFRQEWVNPDGSVGFDWIAEFSLVVRPGSLVLA